MKNIKLKSENIKELFKSRYINVYDIQYAPGMHYYEASRRKTENLSAIQPDEDFRLNMPDAVTLCVIIRKKEADYLLLFYEYRYPAGRFLLSPPAGLIDSSDKDTEDPLFSAAVRELFEETGIVFRPGTDVFKTLNKTAFSTPGMSDETNAIALIILDDPDLSVLTDSNTEGTELFDGFVITDKKKAEMYLETGTDDYGNYYSIYTWQDLLYYLSDFWKKYI